MVANTFLLQSRTLMDNILRYICVRCTLELFGSKFIKRGRLLKPLETVFIVCHSKGLLQAFEWTEFPPHRTLIQPGPWPQCPVIGGRCCDEIIGRILLVLRCTLFIRAAGSLSSDCQTTLINIQVCEYVLYRQYFVL